MSLARLLRAPVPLDALLRDMGGRARLGIAKMALTLLAAGLLGSAGLVALAQLLGYPLAATLCAAACAVPALTLHLIGRARARARHLRDARAQDQLQADMALAGTLLRVALPLVALVGTLLRWRRR